MLLNSEPPFRLISCLLPLDQDLEIQVENWEMRVGVWPSTMVQYYCKGGRGGLVEWEGNRIRQNFVNKHGHIPPSILTFVSHKRFCLTLSPIFTLGTNPTFKFSCTWTTWKRWELCSSVKVKILEFSPSILKGASNW